MDVFDLSNTLKISKIALDSATILVADSPNGGDQTLPEEDDKDANANIAAQQKQQQRLLLICTQAESLGDSS